MALKLYRPSTFALTSSLSMLTRDSSSSWLIISSTSTRSSLSPLPGSVTRCYASNFRQSPSCPIYLSVLTVTSSLEHGRFYGKRFPGTSHVRRASAKSCSPPRAETCRDVGWVLSDPTRRLPLWGTRVEPELVPPPSKCSLL